MQTNVVIKLLSGAERRGMLARPFNPDSTHVELYRDGEVASERRPLEEIAYIRFLGNSNLAEAFGDDEFFEDVTTVTGDRFHLRLKRKERLANGFFGYPTDHDSNFNSIFFTNVGLLQRHHDRPIGEVLLQKGLVEAAQIDAALNEQKILREKRLGEILVEQHNLAEVVVEKPSTMCRKTPKAAAKFWSAIS